MKSLLRVPSFSALLFVIIAAGDVAVAQRSSGGIRVAQRVTVYMTIVASYRAPQGPPADPAYGLFVSADAGLTWQHRGWREYIRTFYSEAGNDGTIWSACGNGVLRSTDNGIHWKVTTGWEVTEVLKVKAAPSLPSLVFASTAYGVFRSTDRGETWEKKTAGMRRPFSGDVCIDRTDPRRVLAATEEGVYLSENGGETWRQTGAAGKGVRVVVQDPFNASQFWFGTEEDGVYRSTDSGKKWAQRSPGSLHSAVYTIAIHPRRKDCLYLGTYGDGIFVTTDGGRHWEARSNGLSNMHIHALVVLPSAPDVLLAGTLNHGLFRSTDSGGTWQSCFQDSSQVWGLSVRTEGSSH